jgi:hypothetical protein
LKTILLSEVAFYSDIPLALLASRTIGELLFTSVTLFPIKPQYNR